jgi:protein-S-isoprenylcysteine O-methyltransferase Ste14
MNRGKFGDVDRFHHFKKSINVTEFPLHRRFGDLLLFGITAVELTILFILTPVFSLTDWIYVLQHTVVLGIALTRGAPKLLDRSLLAGIAVAVSYTYSYAQVICLSLVPGDPVWPAGGLVLVMLAAFLSFFSLITLGKLFGVRPALRGLATTGPYRLVRHPMYLSYMIGDIGYNLQEWNFGTVLLLITGWVSLLYRIRAEERVLAEDDGWLDYTSLVRYRLVPGIW